MSLDRELLARPAIELAPLVLGAVLRHGGVALRITEVEAYLGDGTDPGSHAFRGRTRRNAAMYGPPGHLYAYFSYGMHVCANIVCSPEGAASALLLRGGEIVDGLAEARSRRTTSKTDGDLARGPARLTIALGIGLGDDGADLGALPFELTLPAIPAPAVRTGPRTGVSGPGGGVAFPWRFWLPGEPTVSPYRRHPQLGNASGV
ncbi:MULTISPECIES: DNA-3-methyladenine glycosylase [unclassified Cryobacterium]|uniref:DNA-3-methyladenine glycosylase n=1 Tax=unclassified Cryobacterium TaxID=2649013 RepID=UPI00106BED25|nr:MULTISPECIES: DNA-3-methyladenine glycosylase [unclassified Cryobacterium]TFC00536.1 DNA-3-methyladenine glycosylase [Cryobacterium sp. MDB2-A-1]TFC03881.1 DNA-3-methyladenine glycosylase [Cryobacterium sp. MDB2-33-2]TFC13629.1 DNA-3-methyladenine glycosylase [Cryobacterium sp. MDB2-A-2]TFC14994.1 DNA-3-methyladenine glycosylase [Cryobacterium sp. MDB2-10]TFC27106.1 DNA-3-methyladenine glycosylase [Cryobacterium sp. MDB1-18-2]